MRKLECNPSVSADICELFNDGLGKIGSTYNIIHNSFDVYINFVHGDSIEAIGPIRFDSNDAPGLYKSFKAAFSSKVAEQKED